MKPIEITLPWPPTALSPNTRQHWSKLAAAKKAYRAACWAQAIEQKTPRLTVARLHVALVFYPPSKRGFDLDNMLARMKSGLDGLSDALGVDDSKWSLSIKRSDAVGGMVKVTVTEVLA